MHIGNLIKGLFMLLTIGINLGCAGYAGELKQTRPWPSDSPFPFFPNLTYVYPAPAEQVYPVLLSVLTKQGFKFDEVDDKDALRRINRYGKVLTDYLIYEEDGKKYRKWCKASVFVIPGYPNYSEVSMTCFWDVYEFGFGRGGIHNLWYLFKWKKDWYSEPGIFVVEDMLELIREELGLKQDEVIRPRIFLPATGGPPFIIRYEAEKLIREGKAKEILYYTDNAGYSENRWYKVQDANGREMFEKSNRRAEIYLNEKKIVKAAITIISKDISGLTAVREFYFYENGQTAFFYEKQMSPGMINPEKYKKFSGGPYIIERKRIFTKSGEEVKKRDLEEIAIIVSTGERLHGMYDADTIKDMQQIDFIFPIYRDVNSLPFDLKK